ncbi:MAG: esterase/lipase family protein [Calditrichia bacterium]
MQLANEHQLQSVKRTSVKRPYPVVLAHGILRPDILFHMASSWLKNPLYDVHGALDRFHYFSGICSHLNARGIEAYTSRVSFTGSLKTRSNDLKTSILKILSETGHKKVHIIGHSMGGLDARHMITVGGMAGKVASLTTIGTPHRGAYIIDWALENGGGKVLNVLNSLFSTDGFRDLTTDNLSQFNERIRHRESKNNVRYQTYSCSQEMEQVFLPLQVTWKVIYERKGANDGLVSEKSQRWNRKLTSNAGIEKKIKQRKFPTRGDHLDQIAWCGIEELDLLKIWNWFNSESAQSPSMEIREIYCNIAEDIQSHLTRSKPLN